MSSQAYVAGQETVRVRKERVHTTMLIELLAVLIFIAMAFAFVQKEERDRIDPWKHKYEALRKEHAAAQAEIRRLQRRIRALEMENEQLQASVRRLAAAHDGPLSPNDRLAQLPKADLDALYLRLANLEAMLGETSRENGKLRERLGRGGSDLPNCPVTAGFLVRVRLHGDGGVAAEPLWAPGADATARKIPGLLTLTGGGRMSIGQFRARAAQVAGWGREQGPPCAFRARVAENHGDLSLYKRQLAAVEGYFYVRKD